MSVSNLVEIVAVESEECKIRMDELYCSRQKPSHGFITLFSSVGGWRAEDSLNIL